jgi:hypothetical protein
MAAADRLTRFEPAGKAAWGFECMIGGAGRTSPHEKEADQEVDRDADPEPAAPSSIDLVAMFAPLLSTPAAQTKPAPQARERHNPTLARLRTMESELDRVATIRMLTGPLEEDDATELLAIVDEFSQPASRAAALQAMARDATPSLVPRLWQALRGMPDTDLYAAVLQPLAPRVAALPASDAHDICAGILRVLAGRRRSLLLDGITALVPVIAAIGDHREIVDTAVNLEEVGTWWP